MGFFGSFVGPVLVTTSYFPVHGVVVESVAIDVHYVFAIAFVDLSLLFKLSAGVVTVSPLCFLFFGGLVFGLGFSVGLDLGSRLPPFEMRHQNKINPLKRNNK